jgi:hypothetical protein
MILPIVFAYGVGGERNEVRSNPKEEQMVFNIEV